MTVEDVRPWLAEHPSRLPTAIEPECMAALHIFRSAVARDPRRTAMSYLGSELSVRELDAESDAACAPPATDLYRGNCTAAYVAP